MQGGGSCRTRDEFPSQERREGIEPIRSFRGLEDRMIEIGNMWWCGQGPVADDHARRSWMEDYVLAAFHTDQLRPAFATFPEPYQRARSRRRWAEEICERAWRRTNTHRRARWLHLRSMAKA